MDEREQRIFALEAEVLALTNSLAEVCRRLAAISPRHDAAVRGGLDGAFCNMWQAHDNAPGADVRHMFDYAMKCVDWHRLLALAPREGAAGRCGEDGCRTAPETPPKEAVWRTPTAAPVSAARRRSKDEQHMPIDRAGACAATRDASPGSSATARPPNASTARSRRSSRAPG